VFLRQGVYNHNTWQKLREEFELTAVEGLLIQNMLQSADLFATDEEP